MAAHGSSIRTRRRGIAAIAAVAFTSLAVPGLISASAAAPPTAPADSALGTWPATVAAAAPTGRAAGDRADNPYGLSAAQGFVRDRDGEYTVIEVPGAAVSAATGTNDRRQIVGSYFDAAGTEHGYLLDAGIVTTIDHPDAASAAELPPGLSGTGVLDINNRGRMVGSYVDREGTLHGFVRSRRGSFTSFDFPAAARTGPHKINDRGRIVGLYSADGGNGALSTGHGFVRDRSGRFVTVDAPGVPPVTDLQGLNDRGDIVGARVEADGSTHGFVRDRRGAFTAIDVPGAPFTSPFGINNRREVVGQYADASGTGHGFLRDRKGYTTLDAPGDLPNTAASDISDAGEVVGFVYSVEGASESG